MSASLEGATIILDESKFDGLPADPQPVEIHYHFITPFVQQKAQDDEELADDDVVITGPVYVGNDSMLDRHGELVDVSAIMNSWDSYSKNAVILFNHSKSYGVIGKMTDVQLGGWDGLDGEVPIGRAVIDGGEADIVRKIRKGMLKAFSIGFIAKAAVKECMDDDEESCYIRFTEIEWVETSVVDVPASPDSLFSVEKRVVWGKPHESPAICDCEKGCSCAGAHSEEKEAVGVDLFTTEEEAAARAEELGCEGTHTQEVDGETLWMPCMSMDDYEAAVGGDDEFPESDDADEMSLAEILAKLDSLTEAVSAMVDDRVAKAIALSRSAEDNAESVIESGNFSTEEGWEGPTADVENEFIEANGWEAYGMWYLGRREESDDDTKEHYAFPFTNDFETVSRAGLNAIRGRAGQTGDESVFEAAGRLRDSIDANQESLSKTASVNSPVEQGDWIEATQMADEETQTDVVEEPITTEEAVEEIVEEVVVKTDEVTEEVAEEVEVAEEIVEETVEEVEEEAVEEVVEKNDPLPKPVEVLIEVVKALTSVDTRVAAIEQRLNDTDELKATILELQEQLGEMTAEKVVAEQEAAIEAEVSKRVAAHIGDSPDGETAAPERKSIASSTTAAKSDVTRFDPTPEVSKGMNGLANWLESQLVNRGE